MEHQEPDHAQIYQRKMQTFYAEDVAAKFKEQFWPADPYETGVLVDAADLAIDELVKVYAAAELLHERGDEVFLNSLILHHDHLNLPPLVQVNPLWIDARRQRRLQICNLLYSWYWEISEAFQKKLQKIVEADDPQLIEYVRQAEEALGVSWLSSIPGKWPLSKKDLLVAIAKDSPTILIE
jgi:hypothetical protein